MHTKVDTVGIASVLGLERHQVPIYQRSFVWNEEEQQVEELLVDIGEAFNRKEEFFLGSIVVISAANHQPLIVVDGQQRLAIITLLIARICENLLELGEKDTYAEHRRTYIAKYIPKERTWLPRLILNQTDDPCFQALLTGTCTGPQKGDPESYTRLYQANRRITDWITNELTNKEKPAEWLIDFVTFLDDKAYVIYFKVPDDANAFLIFETLNDRGLDLSTADLVKNYVLGHAGADKVQTVLGQWNTSVATLRLYGGEDLYKTFLRQYWISRHGLVREKQLYSSIKSIVTTSAHVQEFATDIVRSSYLYAAILSGDHEFWTDASIKTREGIGILYSLFGPAGVEQYRPALLSTLRQLEMNEIEKVVRLMVSWTVRLVTTASIGGGTIETHYAEIARAISSGELKNAKEIAKYANDNFIPGDAEFKKKFIDIRVPKAKLARYLLHTLELQARGRGQHEEIPNPDSNELTLEHVLPQRPRDGYWQEFNEEDRKYYAKRLGNMALLLGKTNNKISNGPFEEKRKEYAESKLLLTQNIGRPESWDQEAIEERQQLLANLAVKAWKTKQ